MHRIRRSACVLAGLFADATAALAATLAASPPPSPVLVRSGLTCFRPGNGLPGGTAGWTSRVPAPAHAAVTSGMPGWQITLIAIGATLLAAAAALLLDRAWMARRHATAKAA